jgi:dTDP-L-rhamnose 4-epimerase
VTGNYRLGDIRHNFADLSKISSVLGYTPKFNFEQGLKKFTDWVNTQEIQEDRYQISIEEMKAKGLYK